MRTAFFIIFLWIYVAYGEDYGIVINALDKSTKLYIYSWPERKFIRNNQQISVIREITSKTRQFFPDITRFVTNSTELSQYLNNIVIYAQKSMKVCLKFKTGVKRKK